MSDTWVSVTDRLPDLGDYSVLAYWAANGGMDMVHVQDYFAPITNGRDEEGAFQYTHWYLKKGVTHWHSMPTPPEAAGYEPEQPPLGLLAAVRHEDAYGANHLDGAA